MNERTARAHDVPLAVPAMLSNADRSPAQIADISQLPATTLTSLGRTSTRVGRRALSALRDALSPRDWDVLRTVAAHRYLTTRQVEGFCFTDHATPLSAARVCRRVLRRLDRDHVLIHLDRRVGGVRAGSASYVWQLAPAGDRLLREAGRATRRRQREPGQMFLDHALAVADAHLALVCASRAGALELLRTQTEPECWRSYIGIGGARLILQPDLYIVTGAGEFEDHWFVEIDRGTENPARLLTKCERYADYRRTGTEQADGGSFPLVVWVMPDETRAERLRADIANSARLDRALFRITTYADFLGLVQGGAL